MALLFIWLIVRFLWCLFDVSGLSYLIALRGCCYWYFVACGYCVVVFNNIVAVYDFGLYYY